MADTRLTLADFAKAKDPNGLIAEVYELFSEYNAPVKDGSARPANAPYGHRVTLRRSLPAVGTAKINKGVVRSKSVTDQAVDTIGFFAGRSEIDTRIRKVEGDAAYAERRRLEDLAFEEALAQLVANNFFYGDQRTDEAAFDGLRLRLNTLNEGTSRRTSQVWGMGAAVVGADSTSIYLVDWGERATTWIFPPATTAGLEVKDHGDVQGNDVDGNPMEIGLTTYDWMVGLSAGDPRHIARLGNIDLSDALLLTAKAQAFLFDQAEQVLSWMPARGSNRRVAYCATGVWAAFNKQARSVGNLALSLQEYLGEPTPHIWNVPLVQSEQISVTEPAIGS